MKRMLTLLSVATMLTPAIAYGADIPMMEAPPVVVEAAPVYTWTGFYLGVTGGYWDRDGSDNDVCDIDGEIDINSDVTIDGPPELFVAAQDDVPFCTVVDDPDGISDLIVFDGSEDFSDEGDGWAVGGHVGYNWQAGSFVFGAEADVMYFDGSESDDEVTFSLFQTEGEEDAEGPFVDEGDFRGSGSVSSEFDMEWLGTVRGRLGFAVERLLVYGTGGFAFADGNLSSSGSFTLNPEETAIVDADFSGGDNDDMLFGWTVGAGAEVKLTQRVSLRAEYLYVDLEEAESDLTFSYTDNEEERSPDIDFEGLVDPSINIFRGGLSVHF